MAEEGLRMRIKAGEDAIASYVEVLLNDISLAGIVEVDDKGGYLCRFKD